MGGVPDKFCCKGERHGRSDCAAYLQVVGVRTTIRGKGGGKRKSNSAKQGVTCTQQKSRDVCMCLPLSVAESVFPSACLLSVCFSISSSLSDTFHLLLSFSLPHFTAQPHDRLMMRRDVNRIQRTQRITHHPVEATHTLHTTNDRTYTRHHPAPRARKPG
ncbi:unnamed protein product, partial [Ectocarpus sp. 13 AM-2016]